MADMLCKLNIPYNSQSSIDLAEKIMHFIQDESRKASMELAEKKGVFLIMIKYLQEPWNQSKKCHYYNHSTHGTLSIIAGVSSGIEPLFAISYIRNVMDNDELVESIRSSSRWLKKKDFIPMS